MRLHEIAKLHTDPVIVSHPECGTFILLPDCQVLDLYWHRLTDDTKLRYDSQWLDRSNQLVLRLN